jgi:AcrR family transcriptional regulator
MALPFGEKLGSIGSTAWSIDAVRRGIFAQRLNKCNCYTFDPTNKVQLLNFRTRIDPAPIMEITPPTIGRRERKKAATRTALSDSAMRLFLERGYDNVTVREIADAADVSTTTLMKHFVTKEALVFDRDHDLENALVAAITERSSKTTPLGALRNYIKTRLSLLTSAEARKFLDLVLSTPALSDYWRTMWLRHEHTLAAALATESGGRRDDPAFLAIAHFALEASLLSARSEKPFAMLEAAFDILEHGWRIRIAEPRRK